MRIIKCQDNKPYNSSSSCNFAKHAKALNHGLKILHMKWSITLSNCFLCTRSSKHQFIFKNHLWIQYNYVTHTRNSSGVEFESHVGIWRRALLESFGTSLPLVLVPVIFPSKVPSSFEYVSSWPSKELKYIWCIQ